MLAIFDVFGEWFVIEDFEGCSFINVLLEFDDREHRVRQATVEHLSNIRSVPARPGRPRPAPPTPRRSPTSGTSS